MGSIGGDSPEERAAARGPVCVTGSTGLPRLVARLHPAPPWLPRSRHRPGPRLVAAKGWQVFSAVEGKEQLRMFRADMADEGSFDAAASGCVALFPVAASMDLHISPHVNSIKEHVRTRVLESATRGTIHALQSCVRAGTIRRVVFSSSISTMTATTAEEAAQGRRRRVLPARRLRCLDRQAHRLGLHPVEADDGGGGVRVSAGQGHPSGVAPAADGGRPVLDANRAYKHPALLSPITGNCDPKLYSLLASVHSRFGCVPLAHIQDVCDAHVFWMENKQADGRYLCAGRSYPMAQIAQLLSLYNSPFKPSERLIKDFHGSDPSVRA